MFGVIKHVYTFFFFSAQHIVSDSLDNDQGFLRVDLFLVVMEVERLLTMKKKNLSLMSSSRRQTHDRYVIFFILFNLHSNSINYVLLLQFFYMKISVNSKNFE